MTDDAAWMEPAGLEEVEAAAAHLITACEPDASETRTATLTRLLKTRDYTRAELLLAMREVPFDPRAAHNYGEKGFSLADVQRVIQEHREARKRLRRPIDEQEVAELCERFPELDPSRFHQTTFNQRNEPLYRYIHGR